MKLAHVNALNQMICSN